MRFPEFTKEWEEEKLEKISVISSGGTPNRSNPKYWRGNIPWVSTSLIDFNTIYDTEEKITEEGLKYSSAKICPTGSLLMAMYGQGKTRGKVAILGIDASINQACASIQTNQTILNPLFLFQNLTSRYLEIRNLSNQGGQENLSGAIIKGINVFFPSLIEQNKIAIFLSLLDERIETQNKIIEQYKSLMKGIIDFTFINSERKTYSIKELGEPFRVMNLSKEDLSEDGNECIVYGELFTTYGYVINEIKSKTRKNKSKLTLSTKNDLLFPSSTTVDARSLISPSAILKDGVILGGDMFGIRVHEKFNNEYLSYLFNSMYRNKLAQYAKGSTIVHLHYSEIKNVQIEIPLLDTQNRVVEILTLLQKKITYETDLQLAYQKQKEYLQQEMFI